MQDLICNFCDNSKHTATCCRSSHLKKHTCDGKKKKEKKEKKGGVLGVKKMETTR
jgi:hypothetical protein